MHQRASVLLECCNIQQLVWHWHEHLKWWSVISGWTQLGIRTVFYHQRNKVMFTACWGFPCWYERKDTFVSHCFLLWPLLTCKGALMQLWSMAFCWHGDFHQLLTCAAVREWKWKRYLSIPLLAKNAVGCFAMIEEIISSRWALYGFPYIKKSHWPGQNTLAWLEVKTDVFTLSHLQIKPHHDKQVEVVCKGNSTDKTKPQQGGGGGGECGMKHCHLLFIQIHIWIQL